MAEEGRNKLWLPLESNPDVMNQYVVQLGMVATHQFYDIYGTDPELLGMVPQPAIAVMLLFPCTEEEGKHRLEEQQRIEQAGQHVDPSLYFCKQTVGNACGTIALLHALMNNADKLTFEEGKFLAKFKAGTESLDPASRASALEANDDIEEAHQESAAQGQSSVDDIENVNLHFICFVHNNGHLYELDGTKDAPINHGETTADKLLQDAVKVVQKFMDRQPEEVNFNMVALAPAGASDE